MIPVQMIARFQAMNKVAPVIEYEVQKLQHGTYDSVTDQKGYLGRAQKIILFQINQIYRFKGTKQAEKIGDEKKRAAERNKNRAVFTLSERYKYSVLS